MPRALRETTGTKMQTKLSAWTPLNHNLSNNLVFEERRNLLGKWFDKWTEKQRQQVLQDCLSRCSAGQLKALRDTLCREVPEDAVDFTTVLPRVIVLYIFSFLDPRSLCRCAQTPANEEFLVPEVRVIGSETRGDGRSLGGRGSATSGKGLPPWRDSDRHPTDTIRFNYLENLDPVEHARQAQARSRTCNPSTTPENPQKKPLSASSYKLRQAKSLMFLSLELGTNGNRKQSRPEWAKQSLAPFAANQGLEKRLGSSQWNAGLRPGPVAPPVPGLSKAGLRASQRSQRSAPTAPLFEAQP